ncbi:G patch domain-containing protein 4 [Stigmatopora argus]
MADAGEVQGRGLRFAEEQMRRHGWKDGKGLGREENGISKPIKVKVKCNKGGVGHREGEQFTFQWWDHVFNQASSSLQVETNQDGISLKKTAAAADDGDDSGQISNKKPRKAALAKGKLYGCFVKSATLLSGRECPESASGDDGGSSSDSEDDQKLDLSSTTKLSDLDLMKVCGGRTAHKGARHGVNMSAKLARLEQQEAQFMAKYANQTEDRPEKQTWNKTEEGSPNVRDADLKIEKRERRRQEKEAARPGPKRKKKKERSGEIEEEEEEEEQSHGGESQLIVSEKVQKKSKRDIQDGHSDPKTAKKKKKKKKKKQFQANDLTDL